MCNINAADIGAIELSDQATICDSCSKQRNCRCVHNSPGSSISLRIQMVFMLTMIKMQPI